MCIRNSVTLPLSDTQKTPTSCSDFYCAYSFLHYSYHPLTSTDIPGNWKAS
ncbi:LOW QUALITY PROTEIN: hypothetical protein PanWU01x14_003340 [Parasponia andersonii]|uniref:Uncharacterized protein n=1 Tax=Parasponia andersonii TaxID=3476 RepID=A0A2P5E5F6_PARAD|nr:LOW QUALITY PROTEIN: hypothetical protein PanWU01x14_003340 [Parasponia andersonii]